MSAAACRLTNGRPQRKLHFLAASVAAAPDSLSSDDGGMLLTLSRRMATDELSGPFSQVRGGVTCPSLTPGFHSSSFSAAGFRRVFDRSQRSAGSRSWEEDWELNNSSSWINESGFAQNSKSESYGWKKADFFPQILPF